MHTFWTPCLYETSESSFEAGCAYESDISYLTEVDFFIIINKKMTLSVIIDVHEASLFAQHMLCVDKLF